MINKKIIELLLLCLFIVGFWGVSYTVNTGLWNAFDFATSVKLQEKIDTSSHLKLADFVGNIMEGSTFFASPEFSLLFLFVLTALFCVDGKNKKFRFYGLLLPLLFGVLIIGELYGKTVIHHPSPPFYLIKNTTTIFPKYYINEQFSYPSGHAARAVFLSLSFYSFFLFYTNIYKKKKYMLTGVVLISIYVFTVSLSRVYLGHHWFSDVVGGLLLGCAVWILGHIGLELLTRDKSSHIIPKQ